MAYQKSPEKYVEKIEGDYVETEEMKAGSLIHKMYERIDEIRVITEDGLFLDRSKIPEAVKENEIIQERMMIEKLEEIERKRYEKVKDEENMLDPVIVEEKMHHHRLKIKGIPDAVYKDFEGFSVVELKMEEYDDHGLELAFYKKLIEEAEGIEINRGVVVYSGDEVGSENPEIFTEEELEEYDVEERIKRMWKDIENNEIPEPRKKYK